MHIIPQKCKEIVIFFSCDFAGFAGRPVVYWSASETSERQGI